MKGRIEIVRIGEVKDELVRALSRSLAEILRVEVREGPKFPEVIYYPPDIASPRHRLLREPIFRPDNIIYGFGARRRRIMGRQLLQLLASMGLESERVLGVTTMDIYAPTLNFIFGEADSESGVAVISIHRLRQEFYGLPPDEELLKERALKEALHELGHTWGLSHCPDPRCVMFFSTSLSDTDRKAAAFCGRCRSELEIRGECRLL